MTDDSISGIFETLTRCASSPKRRWYRTEHPQYPRHKAVISKAPAAPPTASSRCCACSTTLPVMWTRVVANAKAPSPCTSNPGMPISFEFLELKKTTAKKKCAPATCSMPSGFRPVHGAGERRRRLVAVLPQRSARPIRRVRRRIRGALPQIRSRKAAPARCNESPRPVERRAGKPDRTGTPYILYKDAANKKSNQKNLGTIRSSNLCTEIIEYTFLMK
jgi:hypothetical protein